MSRVRTLLGVLAWMVLLASVLPIPPSADLSTLTSPAPIASPPIGTFLNTPAVSNSPSHVSASSHATSSRVTPSQVTSSHLASSYLAPHSKPEFTRTLVSANLNPNAPTSSPDSAVPAQSGKDVRELARQAALIRQAASHIVHGPSESPSLHSRIGLCARQVLTYVRLKLIYPVMDAVVSPSTTRTLKADVPATRTWTTTNPGLATAGHRWVRGRRCTHDTVSNRPSAAFPSVHTVGRSIWDTTLLFLDPVLSPSILASRVVLDHSEHGLSRAISWAQNAYDQHGLLLFDVDAMVLSVSETLRPTFDELWSTYDSVTHTARTVASHAKAKAEEYLRRLATYLGVSEEFTLERFYATLLVLSPLLVVQVVLALLDCLDGSAEGHSLPDIELDDGSVVQESHRALCARRKSVFELVLAYVRSFSTGKALSLVVPNRLFVNDTPRTIVCGRPYPRMRVLTLSQERFSALFPQFKTRSAGSTKPRLLIEYRQSANAVDQQTDNAFEAKSTCGVRSTLSVGRLEEGLALVSTYVLALGVLVDLSRVSVNEAFHRLVLGDPSLRIELPTSTSAFLITLLVSFDAHPKPRLLIEYPRPVEAPTEVPEHEAESSTGPAVSPPSRILRAVRPGWQAYRPRASQQDEDMSEWRRLKHDAQEHKLIEAEKRRRLAAEQPSDPLEPSELPSSEGPQRRRRPRAGRQVKEKRARMEEERLAQLGPSSSA